MRKNNGLKIAAVYASIILGAGFASGRELLQYFVGFGPAGLWGLLFAGIIFAAVGRAVLAICKREQIQSYSALMRYMLGERMGLVTEWLVIAFLFCLFVAMLAGGGATARQAFGIPFTIGALIVAAAVYVVLLFDLNGIVKLNIVLAPFMVLGGIFIGLYTFFMRAVPTFAFASTRGGMRLAIAGWILSAIVYASYNLVTGVPILAATSRLAETKRDTRIGGIGGAAIITLLGLCLALPLMVYYRAVAGAEIPLLLIVYQYGWTFSLFYLAILVCALFTTAACNAFAVMEWLQFDGHKKKRAAAALCLLGVLAAHIGFSNMVAYVYPLFGLLGLFKIVVILFHGFGKVRAVKM